MVVESSVTVPSIYTRALEAVCVGELPLALNKSWADAIVPSVKYLQPVRGSPTGRPA
jgi:hypothetical protein